MIKRTLDFILSFTGLILISPILIPIIIILALTGEKKVFYIQERVGQNKKAFGLIKFVTMVSNSSGLPGGDVTMSNDPRVLPVGKFLRKSKINELPQLINILKGEMSIVGPRPTTFRNYSYYSESIQAKIKRIKPGLTGIGSIVFRDEESFIGASKKDAVTCYREDIAPYKGELEVWYSENKSFILDIKLIILTAYVILNPKSNIIRKLFKDLPKNELFTN